MTEKRPIGRPRKAPGKGPRKCYTFRMHDQVRDALYSAAQANGRSLSEEIEARVEASFAEDRMREIAREEIEKARGSGWHKIFEDCYPGLPSGQLGPPPTPIPPTQMPKVYNY